MSKIYLLAPVDVIDGDDFILPTVNLKAFNCFAKASREATNLITDWCRETLGTITVDCDIHSRMGGYKYWTVSEINHNDGDPSDTHTVIWFYIIEMEVQE